MIFFSDDAALDVERLRKFLAFKSSRAADRAIEKIWAAALRLLDFPNSGAPKGRAGVRQIVVRYGASAYVLRYAILAESGDVLILRIWHGREAREDEEDGRV
jgi:toxin ParE1/3/4